MNEWTFNQDQDRKWSWRVTGSTPICSGQLFSKFIDAVADAQRCGFQPGVSKLRGICLWQSKAE